LIIYLVWFVSITCDEAVDWLAFEPYYLEVANDLKLDTTKDYDIANEFSVLVKNDFPKGFLNIKQAIEKKSFTKAWIFGAGPSLEKDFKVFEKHYSNQTDLIVGVDGSSLFLIERDIIPDIIFTDLDGSLDALLDCARKGSIIILHAHGDNYNIVKNFYPKIKSYPFLPTVQTKPIEPFIFNTGGFTDGDRAISGILNWFPKVKIILLGFTFGMIQGRYSKPTRLKNHADAGEFKLKKLSLAKKFIAKLAETHTDQIFNLSKPTDQIQGVSTTFFTKSN